MVLEDVGSAQGDFVTHVAGTDEREVSPIPLDVPVEKLERSQEEARLANPESDRNEAVQVAAAIVVRSSVPSGDPSKGGNDLPLPRKSAATDAAEAQEDVDMVGRCTPVHFGKESEGFAFRESVSHAFLRDSGEVLILLAFPV